MEVDASGEPLTERLVGPWVDRTPENVVLDVHAHRLLTHHAAPIESIWPEVRDTLTPALRDRRQLYAEDLPARSLDAALDRFLASIASVREFGKLGSVVFPFPSYFTPGARGLDYLEWLRGRSGDLPIAIEFRHRDWVAGKQRDATLEFLSRAPAAVRLRRRALRVRQLAATALGRHHRHRLRAVPRAQQRHVGRGPMPATTVSRTTTRTPTSSPGCRAWRSSPAAARSVHVTFSGRTTDAAVRNARLLVRVLSGEPAPARTTPPSGGNGWATATTTSTLTTPGAARGGGCVLTARSTTSAPSTPVVRGSRRHAGSSWWWSSTPRSPTSTSPGPWSGRSLARGGGLPPPRQWVCPPCRGHDPSLE